MYFNSFDFGFGIMSAIFPIVFLAVFIVIIVVIVQGIKQWSYNNAQPQIPAEARVVAKREDTSHHHNANDIHMSHTSTTYYATFEYTNGQRLELKIPNREYGMLAEGDIGVLTSQGSRYIRFDRR